MDRIWAARALLFVAKDLVDDTPSDVDKVLRALKVEAELVGLDGGRVSVVHLKAKPKKKQPEEWLIGDKYESDTSVVLVYRPGTGDWILRRLALEHDEPLDGVAEAIEVCSEVFRG